ncbi:hypothetical protein ACFW04_003708 [Cataglyphis niger]
MSDANTAVSPLNTNVKLKIGIDEDPGHEMLRYRELIGLLMYLAICSRPDISYAVSYLTNCPLDRKSYTGCAFILRGSPMSWESRKQRTVVLSSTESEYSNRSCKTSHISMIFLEEFGFSKIADIKIFYNNGARKLAENPALNRGILKVKYIPTTEMASDFLTKAVLAPKLKYLNLLGLMKEEFLA